MYLYSIEHRQRPIAAAVAFTSLYNKDLTGVKVNLERKILRRIVSIAKRIYITGFYLFLFTYPLMVIPLMCVLLTVFSFVL